MELFKLYGRILVDNDEANKSIKKTGDEAEDTSSKFLDGVKKAGKWAAGIATAAAAAGTALMAFATDAAENLDRIDKSSQRMHLPVEQFQMMEYAAGQCGVSIETLEEASKKLEGTGLNMDQAIYTLTNMTNETAKAQKASELFGESYTKMIPLLNQSMDSYNDLKKQAQELGIVMSGDAVKAGVAFADTWADVKAQFQSVKQELAIELMPYLQKALEWVRDNMPKIKEWIGGLDEVFARVGTAMTTVWNIAKSLLLTFNSLLHLDFKSAFSNFNNMLNWGSVFGQITSGNRLKEQQAMQTVKQSYAVQEHNAQAVKNNTHRGAHASGLNTVPYDGYQATLHRGEAVLNAQNASALLSDLQRNQSAQGSQTIVIPVNLDGNQVAKIVYKPLMEISGNAGAALAR